MVSSAMSCQRALVTTLATKVLTRPSSQEQGVEAGAGGEGLALGGAGDQPRDHGDQQGEAQHELGGGDEAGLHDVTRFVGAARRGCRAGPSAGAGWRGAEDGDRADLTDVEVEGVDDAARLDGGGREQQAEAGEDAELEGADVRGRAGDEEGEVEDGEHGDGLGEAEVEAAAAGEHPHAEGVGGPVGEGDEQEQAIEPARRGQGGEAGGDAAGELGEALGEASGRGDRGWPERTDPSGARPHGEGEQDREGAAEQGGRAEAGGVEGGRRGASGSAAVAAKNIAQTIRPSTTRSTATAPRACGKPIAGSAAGPWRETWASSCGRTNSPRRQGSRRIHRKPAKATSRRSRTPMRPSGRTRNQKRPARAKK
jgi:hypothetical protein